MRKIYQSWPEDVRKQFHEELAERREADRDWLRKEMEAHKARQEAIERERLAREPEMKRQRAEDLRHFGLMYDVQQFLVEPELAERWWAWLWWVLRWRRWRCRRDMAWLCESLRVLTSAVPGDRFWDLRAEAWIATADLHRRLGHDGRDEADCLAYALTLNPKARVKRRLKALLKNPCGETMLALYNARDETSLQ